VRRVAGHNHGFTLIELSIVLVIIGLIIGGILVGQELVGQAATRATLAQIQKFNTAANTFVTKYGYLPGDLPVTPAAQFGFSGMSCNGGQGARDGNGLLDGYTSPHNLYQGVGENELFWSDLSTAGFIDAQIPNGNAPAVKCNDSTNANTITTTTMGEYLPLSKLGNGNYVYVYEMNGQNWFGLSAMTGLGNNLLSSTTIPVTQAYNMDKKVDDGLPTTGNVVAVYISNSASSTFNAPSGNPDTASTCYNSSTLTYSTNIGNGSNPNCALSFKMQGQGR
jgi:prepilin-type N-terminal cleavage/methylation domain-containing protein